MCDAIRTFACALKTTNCLLCVGFKLQFCIPLPRPPSQRTLSRLPVRAGSPFTTTVRGAVSACQSHTWESS